jgi:multimeric flavodoxin WrbA
MKITVLNGSPRKENTSAMVDAFVEGAQEAGHEVEVPQVGKMKIAGCMGCEYCHGKGEGQCIQKDDWQKVQPAYEDCDMVVFASPIYYFTLTAQMEAAIQRVYCIGQPPKATKAAMLLSSGSPGVYDGAIAQFKGYTGFTGIENAGVITAAGDENQSEAKLAEIREFAKNL